VGETWVDLLSSSTSSTIYATAEEPILTEIVAKALDCGATTVTIATPPSRPAMTILKDGAGTRRRELARYHDIAARPGVGLTGIT